MPKAQTFSTCIGVLIIFYIGGALLIAKYLEKRHSQLWEKIGRPSLLNWGIANSARLAWTMLFGTSIFRLKDKRLDAFVWTERALFAVILALITVWVVHYHNGHSSN